MYVYMRLYLRISFFRVLFSFYFLSFLSRFVGRRTLGGIEVNLYGDEVGFLILRLFVRR